MGYVQRKEKWIDGISAQKLFVPTTDDFMPENEINFTRTEQFPPSEEMSVSVGIMSAKEISFGFSGDFAQAGTLFTARQTAKFSNGQIAFNDQLYDELLFTPVDYSAATFELADVTIGINFHWERKENQRFRGALKLIVENDQLTAINIIRVEDYLFCVIASEMSATASLELLKAHAVISRSWLMKPILEKSAAQQPTSTTKNTFDSSLKIKWYERDAHRNFDVCADDHCQRYQGLTRAKTDLVRQAIEATRGQVLMSDGQICDARFSKSCGGVSERFSACWANTDFPYLQPVRDAADSTLPDLTIEANARAWILSAPVSYCNTTDKHILAQVLNNYDQETTDFYRWRVHYTQRELSELVHRKSGIDFGEIVDLIPVERGASGRLIQLKIVGTQQTITVGKELEIRKWLSPSHLYSSAFVVEKDENGDFTLIGAGWGHGVGLCQIGAAVMGAQGFKYDAILAHYFRNSELKKLW